MSLQIWLPFTDGTLSQQGLNGLSVTGTAFSSNDNGKLGKCIKTTSTSDLDTNYSGNQINIGDISFGGWFKFNKSDIESAILGKTYSSSSNYATGNVLGNNSYGGICLRWMSNNIYTDSELNSIKIDSYLRSNNLGGITTSSYIIPFDTWTHIFTTYSRSTRRLCLWINGSIYSNVGHSADPPTDFRTNNLKINYKAIAGGNGVSANIPFYINDVRIYDHALSEKEVKELSKGLMLHYKLSGPGGENMIPYSSISQTNLSALWASSSTTTMEVVTEDNIPCYHLTTTSTSSTGRYTKLTNIILDANTTYTFSYYIKVSASSNFSFGKIGHFQVYNANSTASDKAHEDVSANRVYSHTTLEANKWTRVYVTFTTNSLSGSYFKLYLWFLTQNVDYWVYGFKLEKGDKSTPWAPSPSDTEYSLMGYDDNIEYDLSGYKNNGTRTGTFTWTSDTPRYSSSTYFEDYTRKLRAPLVFTPTAITMAVWIKSSVTGCGSYHMPLNIDGAAYEFSISSNGNFRNGFSINGSRVVDTVNSKNTLDGQWHHLCATYDGTTIKRYVDGISVTGGDHAVTGTLIGTSMLYVGTYGTSESYGNNQMYESDIRIYATALSAEDVKELYNVSASIDNTGNLYSAEVVEG